MSATAGIGAAGGKAVREVAEALGAGPVIEAKPEPASPVTTPVDSGKRTITFVRNILPNDAVALKDGTVIQFTRYLFTTSDEVLMKKIAAEMKGNHIFTREGEII